MRITRRHLSSERLHQFAAETIRFTEPEALHFDKCAACRERLATVLRLVRGRTASPARRPTWVRTDAAPLEDYGIDVFF